MSGIHSREAQAIYSQLTDHGKRLRALEDRATMGGYLRGLIYSEDGARVILLSVFAATFFAFALLFVAGVSWLTQ